MGMVEFFVTAMVDGVGVVQVAGRRHTLICRHP